MPYDTERTPLLTPATAGLTSKILSEVSLSTSAGIYQHGSSADRLDQSLSPHPPDTMRYSSSYRYVRAHFS
jgi:hypothetical protein